MEAVYGPDREAMEAVLGLRALHADLERLDAADQILHVDLARRDPDAGMTQVPYEKGALFLRRLEEAAGRERFDAFLRGYFDHFAFRSITTADFLAYAAEHLLADEALAGAVPVEEWVRAPGLPADAPRPASAAFDVVETGGGGVGRAERCGRPTWRPRPGRRTSGSISSPSCRSASNGARMVELDAAFGLTGSPNAEIAHQWLLVAIRNAYRPADARLERYPPRDRPAQAHPAALRGAGRDAGRPRAGARDLPSGPAGLSPDRHRLDRPAARLGRVAPRNASRARRIGPSPSMTRRRSTAQTPWSRSEAPFTEIPRRTG